MYKIALKRQRVVTVTGQKRVRSWAISTGMKMIRVWRFMELQLLLGPCRNRKQIWGQLTGSGADTSCLGLMDWFLFFSPLLNQVWRLLPSLPHLVLSLASLRRHKTGSPVRTKQNRAKRFWSRSSPPARSYRSNNQRWRCSRSRSMLSSFQEIDWHKKLLFPPLHHFLHFLLKIKAWEQVRFSFLSGF